MDLTEGVIRVALSCLFIFVAWSGEWMFYGPVEQATIYHRVLFVAIALFLIVPAVRAFIQFCRKP